MKKMSLFLVMMICMLMSIQSGADETVQSASDCTHAQYSEVHISGSQYLICDDCGAVVKGLGTNACRYDDLDLDGFCDYCGYDIRFLYWGDGVFYESIEEAVVGMRELLKIRDRTSHVFFEVTEEEYDDSDLIYRFSDLVFEHTGVFNEGDYLEDSFLMSGYSFDRITYAGRYYIGINAHQFPCATTGEQEAKLYAKVEEIIRKNGWANLSGFDQLKAVYDWVCTNVAYDYDHFALCGDDSFYHSQNLATPIQSDYLPHVAYNALFEGKSVCSGYSQLLYMFYNKLGVDCRIVSGWGGGSWTGGSHSWNIVELDDLYYFVDATWDAELLQGGQEYAYFLKSKANMTDHTTSDTVLNGYNISKYDYGYVPGPADEIIESGTLGTVEWRLMGDGTLIFSGTGKILNNPVSDKSLIEKLVIGDGISEIGTIDYNRWWNDLSYAVFESCTNLKSVEIGSGLTLIGDATFRLCESLTEVIIPDNVIDIGYEVFGGCKALQSVSLPENIKTLRNSLFGSCYELVDINIPDSVTEIQGYVFDYCQSLVSVELPEGLERLGGGAFYKCISLEEIAIPSSVKTLELQLFFGCTSLTSVTLNEGLETLEEGTFDDCSSLAEIILPSTVTAIDKYCFSSTAIKSINLPASMTEIPMHLFADCTKLESIEIPENVTKVGIYAFSGCDSLTEIKLPDAITELGQCAFANCDNLQKVTLPASLKEMAYGCFSDCKNLTDIVIPGSGVSIGKWAFHQCFSLTSVVFLEGEALTTLCEEAFDYCTGLKSVTFSEVPLSISAKSFNKCSALESVELPEKLVSMAEGAFFGCSGLISVTLPDSLTAISNSAFQDCTSLTSVAFPANLTSIGDKAFYNCKSLVSITVPDSVTSIGSMAFDSCDSLMNVTLPKNITSLGSSVFSYSFNSSGSGNLFCKAGSTTSALLAKYPFIDPEYPDFRITQTADGQGSWYITILKYRGSSTNVVLPEEIGSLPVTNIASNAFSGYVTLHCDIGTAPASALAAMGRMFVDSSCTDYAIKLLSNADGSSSVQIEKYLGSDAVIAVPTEIRSLPVTVVGYNSFYGCDTPEKIILPESITEIGAMAFYSCSNLQEINLPAGITSIGNSAFSNCSSLKEITLPENITQINSSTFTYCSKLTKINLPSRITKISDLAFYCCSSLQEITLPESLTQIGSRTFERCTGLTNIEFPPLVTSIGSQAFAECTRLTRLSFTGDNVAVGSEAFVKCKNLKYVSFRGESASLGEKAFGSSSSLHLVLISDIVPSFHENGVFAAGCTVTIYCYMDSDAAVWAAEHGYEVVYLDGEEACPIQLITLSNDCRAEVGSSFTVEYDVFPQVSNPRLAWNSSNESIVSISDSGVVSVLAAGSATITCSDPNGTAMDSMVITAYVGAESFDLSQNEALLTVGGTLQLSVEKLMPDNTGAVLTWRSSNPSAVVVDENGLVTAVAVGDVTIIAEYENGVSRSCQIHVFAPVTAVSFASKETIVPMNTSALLTVNVTTGTQTFVNTLVTFESSDPSIVLIDQNGLATGLKPGYATVTAVSANGLSDSCTVIVTHERHEWVIDEAVEATCSETGLTEGKHCSVCDKVLIAQEILPMVDHVYAPEHCTPAKLDQDGEVGAISCTKCELEYAPSRTISSSSVMMLPSALRTICSEAFVASCAQQIVLPEGVKNIESRAFADSESLLLVILPMSLESIAQNAFEGCENLSILCPGDSVALQFALDNNLPHMIVQIIE